MATHFFDRKFKKQMKKQGLDMVMYEDKKAAIEQIDKRLRALN